MMTKAAKIVEYVNFLGNGHVDGPGRVSAGLAYVGPRDRRQAQTGAKMVPGPMENAASKMRVSVLGSKTMVVGLMSQAAVGLNRLAEQPADGEESDGGRHGTEFLDAPEVQKAVALTGEQFRFFATADDFVDRLTFQEDMDEAPRTARTKKRPDAEKMAAGAALVQPANRDMQAAGRQLSQRQRQGSQLNDESEEMPASLSQATEDGPHNMGDAVEVKTGEDAWVPGVVSIGNDGKATRTDKYGETSVNVRLVKGTNSYTNRAWYPDVDVRGAAVGESEDMFL